MKEFPLIAAVLTALGLVVWGFKQKHLSDSQRLLLRWLLPLVGGIISSFFSGNMGLNGTIMGLTITGAGGFAVWILTVVMFPKSEGKMEKEHLEVKGLYERLITMSEEHNKTILELTNGSAKLLSQHERSNPVEPQHPLRPIQIRHKLDDFFHKGHKVYEGIISDQRSPHTEAVKEWTESLRDFANNNLSIKQYSTIFENIVGFAAYIESALRMPDASKGLQDMAATLSFRLEAIKTIRDELRDTQITPASETVSSVPLSIATRLSPSDIAKEISKARPLQQDDIAASFIGVPVAWKLLLMSGTTAVDENQLMIIFKEKEPREVGDLLSPYVTTLVPKKGNEHIKTAERLEGFIVNGIIKKAGSQGISLENVTISRI